MNSLTGTKWMESFSQLVTSFSNEVSSPTKVMSIGKNKVYIKRHDLKFNCVERFYVYLSSNLRLLDVCLIVL